jgi:ABC-type multidrug transport system ATPase subunit
MIDLSAKDLGKRFFRHWVFRHLDFQLHSGQRMLLTGPNGSGKSTLMRILAGQMSPTAGSLSLAFEGKPVDPEQWYRHLSWSGPYHELYGDLTLDEAMRMHFRFRKPLLPLPQIVEALRLEAHGDKQLRHFSSGMLHRVKVGLAIFSQSELLLLDEATTNMDEENSRYILDLTFTHLGGRGLLYASNNPMEFGLFEERVDLGE